MTDRRVRARSGYRILAWTSPRRFASLVRLDGTRRSVQFGSNLRESEQAGRSARVEKREQADGLFLRIRRDATNNADGWRNEPKRDEDDHAECRRDRGQDTRQQHEGDADNGDGPAGSRRHLL